MIFHFFHIFEYKTTKTIVNGVETGIAELLITNPIIANAWLNGNYVRLEKCRWAQQRCWQRASGTFIRNNAEQQLHRLAPSASTEMSNKHDV